MRINDLTGKKFGRLEVKRRADDIVQANGRRRTAWVCVCECNPEKEIVVRSDSLVTGNTFSCGCYRDEVINNYRKYNRYDVYDDYIIMYTYNDIAFIIDKDVLEKIQEYTWCETRGYIVAAIRDGKGTIIRLSRYIMDCPDDKLVDHINGNTLDNRKCNLRIVTRSQNNVNKVKKSSNKSGVTGVYWDKRDKKWCVEIGFDNNRIYLGRYADFEEAVKVRKEAEEKYFGEYSFDNSRRRNQEVKI